MPPTPLLPVATDITARMTPRVAPDTLLTVLFLKIAGVTHVPLVLVWVGRPDRASREVAPPLLMTMTFFSIRVVPVRLAKVCPVKSCTPDDWLNIETSM